jgi:putative ABC transport system permease protein
LRTYFRATIWHSPWFTSVRRIVALQILLHDRSTTAGSVLGVVAIIFLVGQQLAVFFGLLSLMSSIIDHSGADIWICSENTDNLQAAGTLPIRYVDRVMGMDEVQWAEPFISSGGLLKRTDGKNQPVQVIGLARPRLAVGPWRFADGRIELLLDYEAVSVDQADLGVLGHPRREEIVEIGGRRVRVAAFTKDVEGFGGTLVYTNLTRAREISNLPADRCSYVLVKLKGGTDASRAVTRLRRLLPKTEVMTTRRFSAKTRLYYITNTGIGGSFAFSTLIGSLVGVVIITLTMYTNILNRQKDFAVLRAIGARKWDLVVIVLFQAFFIALIGLFVGFLLLALYLNGVRESPLPSYMIPWVPPVHASVTVVLCIVGSLLAMRRATKIEPASAFR